MRTLLTVALMGLLAVQAVAEEKPAKKKGNRGNNPMVTKLMTALKEANLSDEQTTKIKAAAATLTATMKDLKEKGLTQELNKKRAEASKAAREAGLKGKESQAKIKEALTEEEFKLIEASNQATMAMKKAVAAVLTQEQMEALPDAAKKMLATRGGGGKKGKGKKKKDAA